MFDKLGVKYPIIQAPMAGADSVAMAMGVARAGGMGSLACAMLSAEQIWEAVSEYRDANFTAPLNLNFFCHQEPVIEAETEKAWFQELKPHFEKWGLTVEDVKPVVERKSFDLDSFELIKNFGARVLSFHFGLPTEEVVRELKARKMTILSSATDLAEAQWLQDRGADMIIAQGIEAGGHRASFLDVDNISRKSTLELLSLMRTEIKVPVVAAGGIATPSDINTAMTRGAAGVQLGSLYLFAKEAKVSPLHLEKLKTVANYETEITNIFSGRPARAIKNQIVKALGPISANVPAFPKASKWLAPLRRKSEESGSSDYMQMWSGENVARSWQKIQEWSLNAPTSEELTARLISEAF